MQKAVNAEAKAGLKSSNMVWDSDACYFKNHRLFHKTFSKVQTQGSSQKNSPNSEEFKSKNPKSVLLCDDIAEPTKKNGKKKKRFQTHKQECTKDQKDQFPATGVNIEAPKKKIRARYLNNIILKIAPNLQKTSIGFNNLHTND